MNLRIMLLMFVLTTGCASIVLTQTENSITLQRVPADADSRYLMEAANEFCAKKSKVPDLVLKDGLTYKFECIDK